MSDTPVISVCPKGEFGEHRFTSDKRGEYCHLCGYRPSPSPVIPLSPRKREQEMAPPPERKRATKRPGTDLSGTMSDSVVVPHTLSRIQDVEIVLSTELKYLRVRAQDGAGPMDIRETKRMEMLVKMLGTVSELRNKVESGESPELQKLSAAAIMKKLGLK